MSKQDLLTLQMKKLKKKKETIEQIDVAYDMITDNTSNTHSTSCVNPP